MSRLRDIFFVANEVDETGGVASWQHQMAGLFHERGHRVHVIGIAPAHFPMRRPAPPYRTTTLYGVRPPSPVRLTGRNRVNVTVRRQEAAREQERRRQAERLSRMFRDAAPGAVIIVPQVWAMEWVGLADTAGHLVIGMSHESFEASENSSRLRRGLEHWAGVDRLLALTAEDADQWIREGMNNVGFMPNPLPLTTDTPSTRDAKVVVSIGRLSPEKGVDMLLEAWAEAAPSHPDWLLRIYGTGDEEAALHKQCADLGLNGSVEWAGHTADVPSALRGASVFVQSSRSEGFPLTVLEAMSFAVPPVAFDCAPGVHEIIDDGVDGLLVRPGNTGELARQLGRLMDDQELRDGMGEKARVDVERYAPQRIADRWEELFAFLER
ncbi:glycosyltransferase [Streptomyces sp. PTM05]|uniref:D-inositol 3-phosphate glycosyltransferase n=1 Tax=Streptantibioticus parmotrematis TaxID=2873249 RepID=A0ABS7R344_9ACTN|nr:glycosyltransferase [Streptantibioticus parmotrematis]MBY8888452.1 glycosyltransferase [Streptantibioticus parmotrematis]